MHMLIVKSIEEQFFRFHFLTSANSLPFLKLYMRKKEDDVTLNKRLITVMNNFFPPTVFNMPILYLAVMWKCFGS